MSRNQRKHKLVTKGKSYPIQDSVFYKLSSKKRLAQICWSTPKELKSLIGKHNYRCFTQFKNGKSRIIEEPLPRLDKVHSRIASLLCRIETTDELHSGIKKRSNISNARAHLGVGKSIVTADIKSFFPSTSRMNVFDFFFNTMKCAPDIADLLSRVLTYDGHVPTGSRISMPLAYFANKNMFDEMSLVAESLGVRMTIYVDDLTFSGVLIKKNFIRTLEKITKIYGHKLHPSKTRFYGPNDYKLVTGTAIKGSALFPRNLHLKKLNEDMSQWQSLEEKDSTLSNRILGRMTFIGSLDERYKDKARSFRRQSPRSF